MPSKEDQAALDQMDSLAASGSTTEPAAAAPLPAPKPVVPSVPTQTVSDSMAPDYMVHHQAITNQSAVEQMDQLAGAPQKPEQATPAAQQETSPYPIPGRQMVYDPDRHAYVPDPNYKPGGIGIADVASDLGHGLLEAPIHGVVRGARGALQSMLDGADDLATWGVHHLPDAVGESLNWDQTKPMELPGADISAPKTFTGKTVEGISQFVASMYTLGKAFGGFDKLPTTAKAVASMFTGFEGKGQDLSNLVQNTPLANPVNALLAVGPNDNEAVARLKRAVEGVGIGKLADGFVSSVRFLAGAQDAEAAVKSAPPDTPIDMGEPGAAEAPKTQVAPKGFDILGDTKAPPGSPIVSSNSKLEMASLNASDVSPQTIQAQTGEPKVSINFARIDTSEDVKTAMQQMADVQAQNIDAARRGVQSFAQTKLGAQSVDAWQTLMDRRQGDPLSAEKLLAARQLWQQSAVKTSEIMQAAIDNPTPENLLAFRKQFSTHAMIQQEVVAARTEAARSVSAMRISVGGGDEIDRMGFAVRQLDQFGGLESNLDFLKQAKALVDAGRLEDLGNVAEKSLYARTRDGLITGWTNGLLTNPLTHVKVNLSNIATMALRLAETRTAESWDKLTGSQDGVVAGETAQTAGGLIQGIKDAFRYVGKSVGLNIEAPESNAAADAVSAFKAGHYTDPAAETGWGSDVESQLASQSTQMSDSGWLGKGMDLLQQTIRVPGRALTAEHQFYRSIGMRMELNRYAIRQATAELNAGQLTEDAFQGRIAELVENPPPNITTDAVSGMTYQTFTDAPGKLAETIEKLRTDFPLTKIIIPFYKIPSRMLSFTFERSPLAPLMSSFRADVAAGGARQSMALAKMGLGSAVMLATADGVLNGQITGAGPTEKGQKLAMENEGWLPYSIKIGNRWVQYNRLETLGSSMAMAADAVETIKNYQTAVNVDDPDVTNLTAALTLSIANDVTSKTYLEGMARFFEAMGNPKEGAKSAMLSMAGSFVPAGVGAIARGVDPYQRTVNSMTDALKAKTPGLSKDLPPMRNVWGEPVSHESGFGKAYDAFVPFATRQPANEPIDQEILRLGMNVNLPPATTSISGARVNLKEDPKIYSRYVQLAGNEIKDPLTNMGTKDALNALVSGTHPLSSIYNMRTDGPDGGKAVMIQDIIRAQRDRAKQQLVKEFPDLAGKVSDAQAKQQALKALVPPSQITLQ